MRFSKKLTTFQDIHSLRAHQNGLKLQNQSDPLQIYTLGLSQKSLFPQSKLVWKSAHPKSGKSITFDNTTQIKIFDKQTEESEFKTGITDFDGKRATGFRTLHVFHIGLDASISDLLR